MGEKMTEAVDAAAMAVQNLIDREHHKGRRATAHEIREVLRSHLAQPAQAVDVEHEMVLAFRAGAKWADEHVASDGRLIGKLPEPRALTVARASNEYAGERTAALPNANGKEGAR